MTWKLSQPYTITTRLGKLATERLASLGIMGAQFSAPKHSVRYCCVLRGISGVSSIWQTWLSRDGISRTAVRQIAVFFPVWQSHTVLRRDGKWRNVLAGFFSFLFCLRMSSLSFLYLPENFQFFLSLFAWEWRASYTKKTCTRIIYANIIEFQFLDLLGVMATA